MFSIVNLHRSSHQLVRLLFLFENRSLYTCYNSKTLANVLHNSEQNVSTESNHQEKFEPVIGLEVHAQILSKSKLFSSANTEFISRPNSQVHYFDLSLPGTLPVLNRHCVETAVRAGLALNCSIARTSRFDRKHYFYGDMPNGYQITQQFQPIANDGFIDFIVYDEYFDNVKNDNNVVQPYLKRCRLKQIQLEQDSGKSLVDSESNQNLIDLNRAGIPLMEFVFEPDLCSELEATSLIRELIRILHTINACSCKMQEGALRVDANISIRPSGSTELGVRTEIKNLNSFRFMREAINHEIERQTKIVISNGKVVNETLGYDMHAKQTFVMRDKEIVQDYRFMPEPNLPPIILQDSDHCDEIDPSASLIDISVVRKNLPNLPQNKRDELLCSREYGLTLWHVFHLTSDESMRQLFYKLYSASNRKNGSDIVSFLVDILKPVLEGTNVAKWEQCYEDISKHQYTLDTVSNIMSESYLAELVDLLYDEKISKATTIDIIRLYIQGETKSPREVVETYNWWQIKDMDQIEKICRQVVEMLPKIAKKYKKTGVRKPKSMLIQKALVMLGNQTDEEMLWQMYDKILRKSKQK